MENIGKDETSEALALIRNAKQEVLEIQNLRDPLTEIHNRLKTGKFQGLVLVGGYDVLPAQRLDVLDADLRRTLGSQTAKDADNFIVWSDEVYGDLNGDSLEELPVTRIPDAKSSRLVLTALRSQIDGGAPTRFGLRNEARLFAVDVYSLVRGEDELLMSSPTSPGTIGAGKARGSAIYFMLHGSNTDGSQYWGEDNHEMFEALNVSNLAASSASVVFTGCCWGALTVEKIASETKAGDPIPVRTVPSSIALSFLQGGAVAFVGCTGSHYSPLQKPYKFYGGPMHAAFWQRYNEVGSPAVALFKARKDYLAGFPHGRSTDIGRAIEMKTLRQYTCLGLGW